MPSRRKRLRLWTVRWFCDEWQTEDDFGEWAHPTKRKAVAYAVEEAKYDATPEKPISLRIYTKDGRIQEERTYPRSADPRRSRG